jgi:hypothetical protein
MGLQLVREPEIEAVRPVEAEVDYPAVTRV